MIYFFWFLLVLGLLASAYSASPWPFIVGMIGAKCVLELQDRAHRDR